MDKMIQPATQLHFVPGAADRQSGAGRRICFAPPFLFLSFSCSLFFPLSSWPNGPLTTARRPPTFIAFYACIPSPTLYNFLQSQNGVRCAAASGRIFNAPPQARPR